MASFYDDASLVVIPSGYKTSKIYAEKPTDGSGDLTFTRASGATRVGPDGLIEKVRTNLILQSNTFSNASWTKSSVTVTGGQAGYDGTNNAWLLSKSAVQYVGVLQNVANSGLVTCSFYAKAGTNSIAGILCVSSPSNLYVGFDLTNGSITGIQNGVVSTSAQSVGNGWYRLSATFNGTISQFNIYPDSIDGASAGNILIQNAQVEQGDIATAYIPTTTAAVSVGPVSNVPRLDYLGSSCPRLLLEPQRTNVVTYSEQLDNAAWIKTNAGTGLDPVVTANNAISPDGTQNADTVVFNSGAGTTAGDYSFLYQPVITGAGSHTASFYAKTASGTAQMLIRLDSGQYQKITITNQWQRFTLTQTLLAGTNFLDFILRRGIDEPLNSSATIQLWGAQVEAGAYATSYIPTLAASVTRVGDAASKTGISSLIGQTEGTLFADIDSLTNTDGSRAIAIQGGGSRLGITVNNTNVGYFVVTSAGLIISTSFALTTPVKKVALSYKSGITTLFCNGVLIDTDTATYTLSGSLAELYLGQFEFAVGTGQNAQRNGQALLFKTRLTNAQLAELTTL